PRDSADRDSSVPTRVTSLAGEEDCRNAQATEFCRDLQAGIQANDFGHRIDFRMQSRGCVWRDPATPADRPGSGASGRQHSTAAAPGDSSNNGRRRSIASGSGRFARPLHSCFPCNPDRIAAKTASSLSDSRIDRRSSCLSISGSAQPVVAEVGHLLRRTIHGRSIELLGKLFAARLSDSLARHRREFCCERWRANDWNIGSASDDAARRGDAGRDSGDSSCLRSRRGGVSGLWHMAGRELLAAGTKTGGVARVSHAAAYWTYAQDKVSVVAYFGIRRAEGAGDSLSWPRTKGQPL